ncbi:MAG: Hsp70 family protein [Proteobacteria bacterium]|nr:Hsp70 family protein [Pseudomonadota bacterium]MBU4298152.1 Hsp70 family protein [Pseudomonadota bacterium]MCG2748354.1 Hsp70 family protein [Desulfobulbaceae bacterium]
MTDIIIGIDLGTTNSEVALYENGKVTVIEGEGGKIMPSFAGIDENGALLVGVAARNQYVVYPERTVKSIKRRMGEDVRIALGEQSYSPQEISAILLKQLKAAAEKYVGAPVNKAVITVPAYFSDAQRLATREAGEIAGLEVVKMINEPTAAALVYESGHQGSRKVLVYDLGGGTFDVSVVAIEDDVIEVISSHGNNHLGGDDFDLKLVEHLCDYLRLEHGVEALPPQAMARIERAAETAKKILSDHPFAMVEEEYLLEKDGMPLHLKVEIARHNYEEMIESYIDDTMEAVHQALSDAGLAASDMDEVLLVGGSTRTPLVRERLEMDFGMTPRGEVDPDLCVASGAALQAALINGSRIQSVLVDVTPYTFGTSALGELDGEFTPYLFVPLIKKNTPVPVSKSEVFYTAVHDQEAVDILVCQGEDPDARNNIEIGSFLVRGLSRVPAGNEIIACFSLDTDGILHVSAREKATGLEKSITIENAMARFEENELAKARNKVRRLFGEAGDTAADDAGPEAGKAEPDAVVQARLLIEKAEKLLDAAEEDDRLEMIELIEAMQDGLAAGDIAELVEPMDELSEIIFYLES